MSDVYIIRERIGNCKVCGNEDDLRFGVCFGCADHVVARAIDPPNTYLVWDERNPEKKWTYHEGQD